MIVVSTGDWHLGATAMGGWDARAGMHASWVEQFRQVDRVVDLCIAREADLLIIGGDLFDNGHPRPEIVAMLIERLDRLCSTRVLIAAGNHDQQTVPDRHRTPVEAYLASQRWCLAAVNDPTVVDCEGLKVALLPWLKVAGTNKLHATSAALADALKRMGDQVAGSPALLSGHLVCTEADYSSSRRSSEMGMTTSVLEASVPTALLESLPTMANLLSHIHRGQDMGVRTRYVGSLWKVSFAEQMDSKGCEVLEISEGGITSREQVTFEVRELIEADCSQAGGADPLEIAEMARAGDVVRLWRDPEGDPRRWSAAVEAMNAKGVLLEAPRRPKPRAVSVARAASPAVSATPLQALTAFMTLREVSGPEQDLLLQEYADAVADMPVREQPGNPMAELGAVQAAPQFVLDREALDPVPDHGEISVTWGQVRAVQSPEIPSPTPSPESPERPAARRSRTTTRKPAVAPLDESDQLFPGILS